MALPLDCLQTAVWVFDIDKGRIIWANTAALTLWESPNINELSQRDLQAESSDAVKASLAEYRQAFLRNEVLIKHWSFSPKGKHVQAHCQFSGFVLDDGRMAMLVEATESKTNDTHLLTGATTIVSIYSIDGRFLSGNPPFIEEYGNQVTHLSLLVADKQVFKSMQDAMVNNKRFEDDVLMISTCGKTWYRIIATVISDTGEQRFLLHHHNIHERKIAEQSLRKQAYTDPLTGLLNRRGLSEKLNEAMLNGKNFFILYIDLDGFKMVNDLLGHSVGDTVLAEVSKRVGNQSFSANTLARFGGDEFICIYTPVEKQNLSANGLPNGCDKTISNVCDDLIERISAPYETNDGPAVVLSASIGVANYPQDGRDIDSLITCADAAMYRAKELGKKRWVRYEMGMETRLKRISSISQRLFSAQEKNELSLHYQPIIDTRYNKVVSFEALLRWNNDALGYVNPQETLKAAEEIGILHDIENWVLQQALADLMLLRQSFDPDISMAINMSGLHLFEKDLVDLIIRSLENNNLSPDALMIELTEEVIVQLHDSPDNPVYRLLSKGIRLNIDDFGTGYSSLAYLHNVPAHIVKLDRAFVDLTEKNKVTLECIYRLITSLDKLALVEGVETKSQSILLADIGFVLQQGYYHGRPKPIEYYLS